MNLLNHDYINVLKGGKPPFLSFYQKTHRHFPANQQDPIRFRNLVRQMEMTMRDEFPEEEVKPLLERFQEIGSDVSFWNHTLDGLAIFAAPGIFEVFGIQRPVQDLTVVADSFHTKPLRHFLQTADRYQILALSRDSMRIFEGNRDVLDEIEPAPGVPRTIEEALGEELTVPHMTVASYGGVGMGAVPMRHGQGGRSDELDIDTERYFRAVDRAVEEHHTRVTGLPLILAALPEYHGHFRELSRNPQLIEHGITINPDSQNCDQLRDLAWQVMQPIYQSKFISLREEFGRALALSSGGDRLAEVAEAAVNGRIDTLLVESDRHLPGKIDEMTGEVDEAGVDDGEPLVDDVLDDLADLVEGKGGRVVVLPSEYMPTQTGIAAIYRF
jgi:hypothetical protein